MFMRDNTPNLNRSPWSLLLADIEDYIERYRKAYSPHSAEIKAYSLRQFLAYLQEYRISEWTLCDEKVIRNYIIYRSKTSPTSGQKPLKSSSMQTQLASIRLFFDDLVERGIISHNPAKLVKPPKSSKRLPSVVEVDLLEKILNRPPTNEHEVRDRAICELFYSSGLRLAELQALNLHHIDFDDYEVRVIAGKGDKDRIVPVGRKAIDAIQAWLPIRQEWMAEKGVLGFEKALFLSERGNRLSARQISTRVKRYAEESGVNINLHPHLLRHSMATHVLESSQDIRLVQELLGHADISTTQVYTHLDFGHLTKVFDAAHPRARKKKGDD